MMYKDGEVVMVKRDNLRAAISEISERRRNVDYSEILRIMQQLGVKPRKAKHGIIFHMPGAPPFMINKHNNGKAHLPKYSVDEFLSAMMVTGWFDNEVSL